MTNRLVSQGLSTWIEDQALPELDWVNYAVEDETMVKEWPLVVVDVTGSEENEIMRGNYDLTVSVALETLPEDTSKAAAATMKDALYELIGERQRVIQGLDNRPDLRCVEARLTGLATTDNDGRRRDEYQLFVVAAAQV